MAIIDRGIDWTHPDFRNADGTTRIKTILDMSGQDWCLPGNPSPVEYTEQQINDALTNGTSLGTRDAVGHGTATAGAAAGNGRAATGGANLRGVAIDADLVIIKATSEGAPAIGDHPAEAAFNACPADVLTWLIDKLDELDQPAVAIWNIGVIGVGVYVERSVFEGADGVDYNLAAEGDVGELWLKSPGGPSRDGRQVIDIVAPGQNAPASAGADSVFAQLAGNRLRGNEQYLRFGGTSGAAPIVVGAVALMLQANPELTADEARDILRGNSRPRRIHR